MSAVRHRLHLARTQYKFSCAHMTVFPDGTKERLHGHNYFVALTLELSSIAFTDLVPFQAIKDAVGGLCQEWKEHTLLARDNPFFEELSVDEESYEFSLCGKRYLLPREDVLVLPVDNISVECLSAHFAELLLERIGPVLGDNLVSLEVLLSEVPGQGAATELGREL